MRKYIYIFKSEVMSNLQYIFNTFVGFIGHFIMLFILFNLYRYLYSDPNEVINGYTSSQMIWYVIFTEVIWASTTGRKLCKKISNDVKSGNVIYNINKPYSYVGYALSSHMGTTFIKSIVYVIFSVILGIIFTSMFPSMSILKLLIIILSFLLAVIISDLLVIAIGMLSFKIEDSGPIYWVYSKLILLLGVLFPIEYFPSVFQPILKYSPVYVTTSGPAKLFVDFSYDVAYKTLLIQVVYLVLVILLCKIMYKKGVRNLNVNGG